MATENRLRAKIRPTYAEKISDIARERDIPETEAERTVVEEGLASLGYVSRPTNSADLWLYYVRFIGQALGLAGLASLALGAFWGQFAGIYGFGLLVLGFFIVVASDAIRVYSKREV